MDIREEKEQKMGNGSMDDMMYDEIITRVLLCFDTDKKSECLDNDMQSTGTSPRVHVRSYYGMDTLLGSKIYSNLT